MPPTQNELCETFRALHTRGRAFVIPNPWDVGSARILQSLGFEALATTSAGLAFSLGLHDNAVSRDAVLAHCEALVQSVSVPINADLGNCFGDDPATVGETFRRAAATGLAGASVEDMKGDRTIYDRALAVERVAAAVDAVRSLPFSFTVTARAENFLAGVRGLDDTIWRLQAYRDAGADVVYAPGLTTADEIAAVVRAAGCPVNVLMTGASTLTVQELDALGVARISTGGSLARAALTALVRSAREISESGTFAYGRDLLSAREIEAMLGP